MTEDLVQAVTDELLAHGEFSSAGNNRSNAEIAAKAVIDIVRTAPQALAATPAVGGEAAWDRMPHLCSVCRKPITDRADHVAATRLMHIACAAQPASPLRGRELLECQKIANEEFERQITIVQNATDDRALSSTGRLAIQERADAAAVSAQRIASRIGALAASPPEQPAADPVTGRACTCAAMGKKNIAHARNCPAHSPTAPSKEPELPAAQS